MRAASYFLEQFAQLLTHIPLDDIKKTVVAYTNAKISQNDNTSKIPRYKYPTQKKKIVL